MKPITLTKIINLPIRLFLTFKRLFKRTHRYAITFITINAVIWSITFICIHLLPNQYVSKWTLILPSAGVGAKIDIDNIGSASSVVNSAFSSHSLSPKMNYKSIAQSSKVLNSAATSLNLSVEKFGKPQIKLVDQTALLYFHVADSDALIAQEKSWALYNALQDQINSLRLDEIERREEGVQRMLKTFTQKLNQAKKNLLKYQSQSDIVTLDQYKRIPILIEEMRARQAQMSTEKEQVLKELLTLSRILGLTSAEASSVMSLQADPYFQQLASDQSTSNALLTEHSSKWGDNHHKVRTQKLKIESINTAMKKRAKDLIGDSRLIEKVSLSDHHKRGQLLYDLIAKKSQYEGIKYKLENLNTQIKNYQSRLRSQSENVSKLDELERQHQIAEAVFTSAVAKIDTGKSDIFASYPMLQMMMEPTLPQKMSGARPQHVHLGGAFGTVMTIIILTLLWLRRRQIQY